MARAASALGVPPRSLARSPPFPLEIELFEEKEEEEAADEPPVRTLFVHAAPEEGEEEEAEAAEEAAEEEEEEEEAAVVPFAAALEQLARAHEACLAAAQQEKCQLRAEISRLKGRIGMLMLALQRSGSPAPSPRREAAAAGSPAARGAARPTAAERPAAAACVSPQLQSSRSAGAPPEAPAATRPSNSPSQRRPLSPRVPEVPRPAPARAPTPPEAEGSPGGSLGRAAGEAASEAAGEAASEAGGEEAPAAEEKEERVTVLTVCGSDRGDDELKDDRNTLLTVEVAFQTSPEKNWSRLVGKFLNNVANKELLCLNPDWVKSTDFIRKVERSWNHVPGATDILANPEFNPRARKNTVTLEHSTFLRRSIFSGSSWGTPGQSYRTPHSALGEDGNVVVRFLGGLVMDPQSPKRICIGMLGLLLMVYDILVMPVELAYSLDQDDFLVAMGWLSQIFWTLDICVSFLTGYYKNSELEMRFSKVVYAYATTWFPIDIIVTVPLWVLLLVDEGSCTNCEAARASTGVKTIRFLRVLRLLRLVKFTHVLSESLNVINSPEVLCSLGIVKYMIGLVMINHVLSCVWYAVGKHAAIAEGEVGWVSALEMDHPATTWADRKAAVYLYLTSLHWTVTQFQGTSDILPGNSLSERLTAVLVVMSAFIIFSWYVSSLTNMMMRLQQLHSDRITEQVVVWGYLSNHNISGPLSVRVKKYIEWKQRVHTYREHDAQVITLLPIEIMADLLEEVRVPLLSFHKFFAMFRVAYPKIVRRLCAEVQEKTPAPDEEIFTPDGGQSNMYFVESGLLEYSYNSSFSKKSIGNAHSESHRSPSEMVWQPFEQRETIGRGSWLAEQILWTNWSHIGKLVGKIDSCLLVLEGMSFTEIVKSNSAAHCSAVYYARRFLGELNRFGKTYTDLLPKTFFDSLSDSHDDDE